ncbi:flavodoxin family protein [Caproicibacter fermentans]|uniref:Flavodoxin family protein n=1 Tax=Caproicibacter fermentans TaxID=2576756 RepID=A0A7G8T6W6_9FIRM|nr:flavodoxin family protein [Caproicibacter fermentans]QNK39357.1 flavodoxin family protein [Caproicibacter fermentans]
MKIAVIHGSPRRGNTLRAAELFLEALKKRGEVEADEFFLPRDLPEFCKGCAACVTRGEEFCPHRQYSGPILDSMLKADALLLTTPVYVMSASGGMKNFLDHYPFLFINHRPRPEFFRKKAFVLSTAAGGGIKSAMKPIATCIKYWGINRVYQKGFRIFALDWDSMPPEKQKKYEAEIDRCAEKFWRAVSKQDSAPTLFVRFYFALCRWMVKKFRNSTPDYRYWQTQGWLDGKPPFVFKRD